MALTLRNAITATQTTFDVTGTDALESGDLRALGDEKILIRSAKQATTGYGETAYYRVSVYRGSLGTVEVAHDAGTTLDEVTLGSGAVAASAVTLDPAVSGESDVQAALGALAAQSAAIASPLDFDGCALWLDASQLALANDAPVATWPDLSGEGNDATQGAGVNTQYVLTTQGATAGTVTFAVDDGENPPVEVGPLAFDADAAAVDVAFEAEGVTVTTTGTDLAVSCTVEFTGVYGAKLITVTVAEDTTTGGGGAVVAETVAGHGVSPDYTANLPVCKTNVLSGLRVVRFDGSGTVQYLRLTGGALDLFRNLDAFTLAAVYANIPGSDDYVFQVSAGDDLVYRRVQLEPNGMEALQFAADNEDGGEGGMSMNLTVQTSGVSIAPQVAVGSVDFLGGSVLLESSPPGSVSSSPTFNRDLVPTADTASLAIHIGATPVIDASYLVGDIAELIVYQRALNARERRLLQEYLSAKWATL